MMKLETMSGMLAFSLAAAALACANDDPIPTAERGPDAGASSASGPGVAANGGFQITVSGEDLAVNGYDFGPTSTAEGDPPAFVDGWEVRFEHVIVTVDNIRMSAGPDTDEGDPTVLGAVVASVDGPFAVDTKIGGGVTGKSGVPDEKTVAIATLSTLRNGQPFDPETRYAFSYDFVAASADAKAVNLDAEGMALYEEAKTKGWAMIFQGTATQRGEAPEASSVFARTPTQVRFKLGLANSSSYVNCENTDLAQLPSGAYPRGIQAAADRPTTVQITLHTDHLFWSKLNVEGTELHFDPIAVLASTYGAPGAPAGEVTIEDLVGVDVTGFTTRADEPLPARSLVPDYAAPAGQLSFDPNGTSFAKVNSYASFLAYSAASGGHLNALGECAVKNDFAP